MPHETNSGHIISEETINKISKRIRWLVVILLLIFVFLPMIGRKIDQEAKYSVPAAPYPPPDRPCEGEHPSYKTARDIREIVQPIERGCYRQFTIPALWLAYSFYPEDRNAGIWVYFDGSDGWRWLPPNFRQCSVDRLIKRPRYESTPELNGIFQVTAVRVAGDGAVIFREENPAFVTQNACQ